jgi:hypothetical protein
MVKFKPIEMSLVTDYNFFEIEDISQEQLNLNETLFYTLGSVLALSFLNLFAICCQYCIKF